MKKALFTTLIMIFVIAASAQNAVDTSFKKYVQLIPGSRVSFAMLPIPSGLFLMGSPDADKQKEADEQPQHKVQISAFWMGAREVTFDEFNLFFSDVTLSQKSEDVDAVTRPTVPYIDLTLGMGKEGGFPAVSMKQYAAMMYCKWLYKKTGIFYRLPTEAEWEYACRAGATTIYPFGDTDDKLGEYAWYKKNSREAFHKTGLKKPNAWGLYDMLGNVSEWVLDQYQPDAYAKIADNAKDPQIVPQTKYPLIVRGGSYKDQAKNLRSANRIPSELEWNRRDPQVPKSKWWNADASFTGFRIMRPLQQPSAEEAEIFYNTYLKL